jgi:uncharacterized protein YegP (UPF0339 family)
VKGAAIVDDVTLELYIDAKGEYRWRAVASNGRILADSAEGYRRKRAALKGAGKALGIRAEVGTDAPIVPGVDYGRPDGSRVLVREV